MKIIKYLVLSFGCPISCPSVTYNLKNLNDFSFNNKFKVNLDWYAWLTLAQEKGCFIYINKRLMAHRVHGKSETSLGIANGIREKEDKIVFSMIWPEYFAKLLSRLYKKSYPKRSSNNEK